MDFKEITASLRRHWPIALTVLALIPIVMAVYLLRRDVVRPPARYTTSADVLIPSRDADTNAAPTDVPPVLLQGQTELALAPNTTRAALEAADLDPDADNRTKFSAKLNDNRSIMTLSVEAPEPETAAELLDEYIVAYQNGRRQSVLDAADELREIQIRVIGSLRERLTEIEQQLGRQGIALPARVEDGAVVAPPAEIPIETSLLLYERNAVLNEIQRREVGYAASATQATAPGTYTTVVQRRSTARITPPPPSPLIPLLEILGVGLLLALAIPVLLDKADSTITEAKSAPGALRAGTLVTVPHMPRRLHRSLAPPGSSWELAFRSLAATSISTDRLPKAIMVTSPSETTQDAVAANFAAGLAGLGVRVALVGTVPRQDWFLVDDLDGVEAASTNGSNGSGGAGGGGARPDVPGTTQAPARIATFPELLNEAQNGRLGVDIRPRLGRRDMENLYIVPPGDEHAELSLDGLPPLLDAMARSEIDITVLAGPALLDDPNATIMAWSTRHVLWAIEIGHVDKNDAALAADRLELAGVEPFGIAIVNRSALRT